MKTKGKSKKKQVLPIKRKAAKKTKRVEETKSKKQKVDIIQEESENSEATVKVDYTPKDFIDFDQFLGLLSIFNQCNLSEFDLVLDKDNDNSEVYQQSFDILSRPYKERYVDRIY